ncbi:MAG: Gfo/Idh/MocA family oxidoreductase, partial [Verrucomicrobia bacterium]|nr:Gfo/Idh/MocA family oxidoreductase [Verrucomicrobiota bacterium]
MATIGGAASAILPGMSARSADNVPGANDRVRVGMIGVGGKGGQHVDVFSKLNNVDVVAICDADQGHAERQVGKLSAGGRSIAQYTDLRKLLEDDSIDAIVTATPNHWHALVTIWALQAGKHVYVEKPVCHNVFEGRMMLKAAKKYGKIVQAGFQNRSDVGLREFFPWLHEGNLGEIEMLYGQCFRERTGIGDLRQTPLDPKV